MYKCVYKKVKQERQARIHTFSKVILLILNRLYPHSRFSFYFILAKSYTRSVFLSKLTELTIRAQKEPCRLADGEGLSFEITKSGTKRWIYRYRMEGKQQMFVVGRYPKLSLKEARTAHREAKETCFQRDQAVGYAQTREDEKHSYGQESKQ